jgi:hypothetical protein
MLRAKGVPSRRIQVYTMIGHEPFAECMDRIQHVISLGGEPYVQPIMKLNSLRKEPWVRHDWTAHRLKQVQRWANRHLWRKVRFEDYDGSIKGACDSGIEARRATTAKTGVVHESPGSRSEIAHPGLVA